MLFLLPAKIIAIAAFSALWKLNRAMIMRRAMRCLTCGHKMVTRTAVGHGDYQELSFPCGECGIEIRYGMKLLLEKRLGRIFAMGKKRGKGWIQKEMRRVAKLRNIEYVNFVNAKPCEETADIADVVTVDRDRLNPAKEGEHFSPFMATKFLPKDMEKFAMHERIRSAAARIHGPRVLKLATHFDRKQWLLFDKQIKELDVRLAGNNELERAFALYYCAECNGKFFGVGNERVFQLVSQRITFAESKSLALVKDLADFVKTKKKDESIVKELWSIRQRWYPLYDSLAPIYCSFYWDENKNSLDDFTLPQKRFEPLKQLYVDCFETFCRISIIAAGFEGIIQKGAVGVPATRRFWSLDEFDTSPNGSKPVILKQLAIADLFVPFIDSHLRNGVGHHSAHYIADKDSIEYVNENPKGMTHHAISYTRFCEKVVRLYGQLEAVSAYAQWLRAFAYR
jgi:hypothetical protein